jgi:histone H3/H4
MKKSILVVTACGAILAGAMISTTLSLAQSDQKFSSPTLQRLSEGGSEQSRLSKEVAQCYLEHIGKAYTDLAVRAVARACGSLHSN